MGLRKVTSVGKHALQPEISISGETPNIFQMDVVKIIQIQFLKTHFKFALIINRNDIYLKM